jgi:hypothetical protein
VAPDADDKTIRAARAANSQMRKAELIDTALERAARNTAASGSGGNIENAVRTQIKNLLNNPKRMVGFSKAERDLMEKIVNDKSTGHAFVRLVGKLSPSGNGLMAMLGLFGTAVNPFMAIPSGVGFVAKKVSEDATTRHAAALENLIRTGSKTGPVQVLTPQQQQAARLRQLFTNEIAVPASQAIPAPRHP